MREGLLHERRLKADVRIVARETLGGERARGGTAETGRARFVEKRLVLRRGGLIDRVELV